MRRIGNRISRSPDVFCRIVPLGRDGFQVGPVRDTEGRRIPESRIDEVAPSNEFDGPSADVLGQGLANAVRRATGVR